MLPATEPWMVTNLTIDGLYRRPTKLAPLREGSDFQNGKEVQCVRNTPSIECAAPSSELAQYDPGTKLLLTWIGKLVHG
jgi:hypothetical protein